MAELRKATFEPYVSQTFNIRTNDGRIIPVQLTSISTSNMSDYYESFTLNFDPSGDETALPEGSYVVENEDFGPAVIFLSATPTGVPGPRRYYYEAVFNVFIGDEDKT